MGAGVSHWQLARTVSQRGHLGVVSGTALDVILVRRLQDGDPGGHMRRGLAAFPDQEIAARIVKDYFIEGGRAPGQPYKAVPQLSATASRHSLQLMVAANFLEVWLAKEGHSGVIGINFLGKIQMATPASLYGAMLGGVDYVLMGAGLPTQIPGMLDKFANHEKAVLRISVEEASVEEEHRIEFDPRSILNVPAEPLYRSALLAIVSSVVAALAMVKRASGTVEGFIVESPTAGGHNAPPRDNTQKTPRGEPLYGPKDEADLAKIHNIGKPFWPAGGYCNPDRMQQAIEQGAAGVQIGTPFALSKDSGLDVELRELAIDAIIQGEGDVYTDAYASPTGFPFKVLDIPGSLSRQQVYESRERHCDLGYLRTPYKRPDGTIGYRCAAEPVEKFVEKGGDAPDTEGRKCLCNSLLANIGLGQLQKDGTVELPLLTAGADLSAIKILIERYGRNFTAADVINYVMSWTNPEPTLA